GYSIVVRRGGRFFPELAEKNSVPKRYWSRLQKGETVEEDGVTFTPDMVLGPPRRGIRLSYCTDTRPTKSIAVHAKEADLFICEGMYGEAEKQEKALEHKHMTFSEAAKLAKEASAKELWLTHYSPSLIRPEDYIPKVRKIFPATFAGKDGKTVVLEFDKTE
ncbi:MAG: ribonuclease Z, partial [Lachnospiraceae bacterium]